MNAFRKWFVERFLRRYVRRGLDYLSGPLNGKKSEITLGLLAIILVSENFLGAQALGDIGAMLSSMIAELGNASLEDAKQVTLIAFLTAVLHRFLKIKKGDDSDE